jgi:hypothetical protein
MMLASTIQISRYGRPRTAQPPLTRRRPSGPGEKNKRTAPVPSGPNSVPTQPPSSPTVP